MSERRNRLLIATVSIGIMINPLNTTMISVAITRLQEQFILGFDTISWLIASYYIASVIGQPLMGKWVDWFGPRKLFMSGLLLVFIASVLAPFSPSFGWLLGFRLIQAIGSSALFPSGMAIIRSYVTGPQARAFGASALFGSIASAIGPSIGALLVHWFDWRGIFLMNYPLLLISFILVKKMVPPDSVPENVESTGQPREGLDYYGMFVFTGVVVLWLCFLMSIKTGVNWWFAGAGTILLYVFIRLERTHAQPFIDVNFLARERSVLWVYVHFVLANAVMYSYLFGLPSFFIQTMNLSSDVAGWLMLVMSMPGMILAAPFSRWIDRVGTRTPIIWTAWMQFPGIILLLIAFNPSTILGIVSTLILLGTSYTMVNLVMQMELYRMVPVADTGIASGLFTMSRFLGPIISSSVLAGFFGTSITLGTLREMSLLFLGISMAMFMISYQIVRQHARNQSLGTLTEI